MRTLSSTCAASSRVGVRIRARTRRGWPATRDCVQSLQHRQRKAGRFAGAGLGAGQHIAAFEDERNGLLLDRGCLVVTLFFDRTQQFGRKAELIK